jgi:hypothetical protein
LLRHYFSLINIIANYNIGAQNVTHFSSASGKRIREHLDFSKSFSRNFPPSHCRLWHYLLDRGFGSGSLAHSIVDFSSNPQAGMVVSL